MTKEEAMKLVKLIITIPKDKYCYIQELEQDNTDYATTLMLYHAVKHGKPYLRQKPKTGHCEDCKHFCKLPYHIAGKCVFHAGLCPSGDWYCADYKPQESEGENV